MQQLSTLALSSPREGVRGLLGFLSYFPNQRIILLDGVAECVAAAHGDGFQVFGTYHCVHTGASGSSIA